LKYDLQVLEHKRQTELKAMQERISELENARVTSTRMQTHIKDDKMRSKKTEMREHESSLDGGNENARILTPVKRNVVHQ
jgi:CBS-domain-containing membrane protein